ncbi:GLRX3 protein, partial [Donacobius atricapilla]|nr:GLRX3 protein [Donacobius atricapilla]
RTLVVVHFWASWAPQCAQMNEVMEALAREHSQVTFVQLEAEAVPEVSEKYGISSVPTFLFFKGSQNVDRLDGAHAPQLAQKVQRLSAGPAGAAPDLLHARLQELVSAAPCMLFMKGTPKEPRCGASAQLVQILQRHGVAFSAFDVLADEALRGGLAGLSRRPSFPQLFVAGRSVGGLDDVKRAEIAAQKSHARGAKRHFQTRGRAALSPTPFHPSLGPCAGASAQLVQILQRHGVAFSAFDVLADEALRGGLAGLSRRPSFPQLFVAGRSV